MLATFEVATQTSAPSDATFAGSASDSISEPICGVKAHKTYVTDNKQIQQLYDENLFRQISYVEHIKATTDELNNLKDIQWTVF